MKIRLYLDEDTMDALRIRGVDVTTALEQGMIRRDDIDHLEFANSHHSGIILGQQRRHSIGEQMRRLLKIVAQVSAEEVKDSIMFLSAW